MRILPALLLPSIVFGQAPELRTTAADRSALGITIYQGDLAAVRDTRRVDLPAGSVNLAFADLAAKIRSKSAYLFDPGNGLEILERNYEFNLLGPSSLLSSGLGQDAAVRDARTQELRWGTQRSVPYPRGLMNPKAPPLARMARKPEAFLVRPDASVVLQTAEGVEKAGPGGIAYRHLPSALRASPTLVQSLRSTSAGPRDLTLIYTTQGLTWSAHYIATLATDGRHLDLDAFATVTNESGTDFPDATFQLVAGWPNVVPDPEPRNAQNPPEDVASCTTVVVTAAIATPPTFKEEKLSEYPLFTLDRPTTMKNGQTKQLALFHAAKVPLRIEALVQPPGSAFDGPEGYLETCSLEDQSEPESFSPLPEVLDHTREYQLGDTQMTLSNAYWTRQIDHYFWNECRHPPVTLEGVLENTRANGLGRALPEGGFDLRYLDPAGFLIPMADLDVDATPPGEELRISLGPAKGCSAERHPLSRRRVQDPGGLAWELTMEVKLRNDSTKSLAVTVREPIFEGWILLKADHPGQRSGANAYDFRLQLPAHGQATLHYLVRTASEPSTNAQ